MNATIQAKIVRQESLAIDANFEKKRKQAETNLKMWLLTPCNCFMSGLILSAS